MYRDREELWFLDIATQILEVSDIETQIESNGYTVEEILARLIELGFIEIPEWCDVGDNLKFLEEMDND